MLWDTAPWGALDLSVLALRGAHPARWHSISSDIGPVVQVLASMNRNIPNTPSKVTGVISVIIPAHNEQAYIGACLTSLMTAAAHPSLGGERVLVVVVLDECTDGTRLVADKFDVSVLECAARNVGSARALGAQLALAQGARWLAFTDADSEVAPNWISQQLCQQTDAVCGTVKVRDWQAHDEAVRLRYDAQYQDSDGHRHIHGANFGLTAQAYRAAGGFQALVTGEDVALVNSLVALGMSIAWTAAARVTTSARKQFRAPDGFGAHLLALGEVIGGVNCTERSRPLAL